MQVRNWAQTIILVFICVATAECKLLYYNVKSLSVLATNPIGTLIPPLIIIDVGGGSNIIQLGQNTTLQCIVVSTAAETAAVDWSTTALSANISNQTANILGSIVSEILTLSNVDSGYCGVYTCTITDSDMMPLSASTALSLG